MTTLNNAIPPSGLMRQENIDSMVRGTGGESLEDFLGRMVSINEAGSFYEPTCPICKSPSRSKAEKQWLDTRNAEQVRQFFVDHGERCDIPVIKNHMEFHLDQSEVEIRKREYVDKILLLNSGNVTTLDRLEMTITSISERMITINAMNDPSLPSATVEKMKTEATCKLSQTMEKLLKFRAQLLGEMKDMGEVFTINKSAFVNLFQKSIESSGTAEERLVVNRIFTELTNLCQEY
jgi:hypothetical protein